MCATCVGLAMADARSKPDVITGQDRRSRYSKVGDFGVCTVETVHVRLNLKFANAD